MKYVFILTGLIWYVSVKGQINSTPWSEYHSASEIDDIYKSGIDKKNRDETDRAAIEYSFLGNLPEARKMFNYYYSEHLKQPDSAYYNLNLLEQVSAKEFILNKAVENQVIMINELHHSPNHRVFIADLLQGLYDLGFRYIGLEALRHEETVTSTINQRGFPALNSGYYLEEPQFANLVLQACSLGYTVFSYESWGKGAERELNQAKNVYSILEKDPEARILIYAGSGHIREDSTRFGKMMAGYFQEISGINPLTINQAHLTEQSSSDYEHPLYEKIRPVSESVVYCYHSTQNPVSDNITDLVVIHPRFQTENGRPNYLNNNPRYHRIEISPENYLDEPQILFAYLKRELDSKMDVIPVDIIEIQDASKQIPPLLLPFAGTYTLVAKSHSQVKFSEIQVF